MGRYITFHEFRQITFGSISFNGFREISLIKKMKDKK